MNKKQEIVTPQNMLEDLIAEMIHHRFVLRCLIEAACEGTSDRFLPYDQLPDSIRSGYRKRARAEIKKLVMPMISFVMPMQVVAITEEEKVTATLPETTPLVQEDVTEGLLPEDLDVRQNSSFYGEMTEILA